MNVKLVSIGTYLPRKKVTNEELERKLKLEKGYIEKRTGIQERYYADNENIIDLAQNAVEDLRKKLKSNDYANGLNDVELIVAATTSSKFLMPGISNEFRRCLK